MKIIFALLMGLMFIAPQMMFAQKGKREKVDQLDELGRKQGNWQLLNHKGDLVMEIEYKNDKRDGVTKRYYLLASGNNKIMDETNYLDGKRDGDYKKYFFNGETSMEGAYDNGKRTGRWVRYYEDGSVRWEGNYLTGRRDGEWKYYNRKGELINSIMYKDGVDVKAAAEAEKAAAAKKEAEKKKAAQNLPQQPKK